MRNIHASGLVFILLTLSMISAAQVPVREEPLHKVVLENDYIRLINVHLPPGDTTLYHIHATPSVIVFISKTTIGSQAMGKKQAGGSLVIPGVTYYAPYDDNENKLIHRVWNEGRDTFHVMDIELVKNIADTKSCSLLQQQNVQFDWEEKLVRVYDLELSAEKILPLPKTKCPHLLIVISGLVNIKTPEELRQVRGGDYFWFPAGTDITLGSNTTPPTKCVLLELK